MIPVRAGYRIAVATHNYRTPVEVGPGQTVVYSTDSDGAAVMARIDAQPDGTIDVQSLDGDTVMSSAQFAPDGTITVANDGDAETTVNADGTYTVGNSATDLKTVLDSLIDELVAFRTAGSPTQHTTDPGTVANLQTIKQQLAQLLK
jgi:hypothetical protein